MFDFNDADEEKKRSAWYKPLGEFVVLFSNVEFSTYEWIRLLSNSAVIQKHIINIWSFRKRTDLIINLIDEYDAEKDRRLKWAELWTQAKSISEMRNVIAHNPPFENFRIDFNESEKKVNVSAKVAEIAKLAKPIGEPGSGLSLDKINDSCTELRAVLIDLDREHAEEIVRYEHRIQT